MYCCGKGGLGFTRFFFAWVCLLLTSNPSVEAFEFEYEQNLCVKSPEIKLKDALDPQTAYNIVYRWNRFGTVHNWKFEEDTSIHNVKDMVCVKLEFDTALSLPRFFADYISSVHFKVRIRKRICVKNNIMTELVDVDDVSLLSGFSAVEVTKKIGNKLQSTITVHYELPWYFQFLKSSVDEHMRKSFQDRLTVMVREFCS